MSGGGGTRHTLDLLPGCYALWRRSPGDPPPPAPAGGLWSVTRTADEVSVVCEESALPAGAAVTSTGWRALRVRGALDLGAVGILASLAAPLARARIPIFAFSTWDTDYLLVRGDDLPRALDALRPGFEIGSTPT